MSEHAETVEALVERALEPCACAHAGYAPCSRCEAVTALAARAQEAERRGGWAAAQKAAQRADAAEASLREAREALTVAHKFAGDVGIWAAHPVKPVDADWQVVATEAQRVKDALADALAQPAGEPE